MSNIRVIAVFVLMVLSFTSIASQVDIKVSPLEPVKDESFQIEFEVISDADEEPVISFDPSGLEILGRSTQTSISTSIANGRIQTVRRLTYRYEAVSDSTRTARLSNIKIQLGDEVINKTPISIKILGRRKTPDPIFLRAEVNKDEVYLGEGVDIRYYQYSRVEIWNREYKQFPKLNGFIKRFHKVDEKEEVVELDDVMYKRSLKYSARAYPEKVGKLIIDPLTLVISYTTDRRSTNPFSLGFGLSRPTSKTLRSKKVEVNVIPLPTDNVPKNFSGLVGKHTLNFSMNKQKFVVNEPVEAKIEIRGEGALEKYSGPVFWKTDALESFDTKAEFSETDNREALKVYSYTFLARKNTEIPESLEGISIFNPETKSYENLSFTLPALTILGEGFSASGSTAKTEEVSNKSQPASKKAEQKIEIETQLMAPIFNPSERYVYSNWSRLINIVLAAVCFVLLILLLIQQFSGNKDNSLDDCIKKCKKNGITHKSLFEIFSRVSRQSEVSTLRELVHVSPINDKAKQYFLELINELDKGNFSDSGKRKKILYKSKYFNDLRKEFRNANI